MSIVIIGKNSFLAQHYRDFIAQNQNGNMPYHFLSYRDVQNHNFSNVFSTAQCVINFACDPAIREGQASFFDLQCAQKAQENGAYYIMISSRAVYGEGDHGGMITEQSEFLPTQSPYALGKRAVEAQLQSKIEKLIILRPSNIFGFEYQEPAPRQTFFGQMLFSLKQRGQISFDISTKVARDFLPVDIFAHYIDLIARAPKAGIYNIGSMIGTPIHQIAQSVIDGYGQGSIIEGEEERDNFVLDCSCAQKMFNLPIITQSQILEACYDSGQRLR